MVKIEEDLDGLRDELLYLLILYVIPGADQCRHTLISSPREALLWRRASVLSRVRNTD